MPVVKGVHAPDLRFKGLGFVFLSARSRIHMLVFKDMQAPDLGTRQSPCSDRTISIFW